MDIDSHFFLAANFLIQSNLLESLQILLIWEIKVKPWNIDHPVKVDTYHKKEKLSVTENWPLNRILDDISFFQKYLGLSTIYETETFPKLLLLVKNTKRNQKNPSSEYILMYLEILTTKLQMQIIFINKSVFKQQLSVIFTAYICRNLFVFFLVSLLKLYGQNISAFNFMEILQFTEIQSTRCLNLPISWHNISWKLTFGIPPCYMRSINDVMSDHMTFSGNTFWYAPSKLKCQPPHKLWSWILDVINLVKGYCVI